MANIPEIDTSFLAGLNVDGSSCQNGPFGGGGYFSFDFPHTDYYYEGNLRWLICAYQKIVPYITELGNAVNQLIVSYDTIPQQVQEAVNQAMVPVYNTIAQIRGDIESFTKQTNESIQEQNRQILAISSNLASLEVYVSKISAACNAYADSQDVKVKNEIYSYLKSYIKEWPEVVCPVDGRLEDLQTVLDDLYDYSSKGVTYGQLDAYGFTYGQVNNMLMTYGQLNSEALELFNSSTDKRFYMFSPITGAWTYWQTVIWQLYRLHFPSSNYGELDGKGWTYEEFENSTPEYGTMNNASWLTPAA